MTISRVSSSANLHKLPIETETNTENIVHVWYLENGDKAYLIRDKDALKCLFLKGNDSVIAPIPIPTSITPEEAIDFLLEIHPVLLDNDSIKLIKKEELHEWDIKQKNPIHLIHSEKFSPDILVGENAFYIQPEYLETTQQDLSANTSLPVSYRWNTEHKVSRIAKQILPIIIFSIGIYKLYPFIGKISLKKNILTISSLIGTYKFIHLLVGKIILIASSPILMGLPKNCVNEARSSFRLKSEWKHKRITIQVDDYKIDSVILGRSSTFGNGRWVLASNGNGEFYEGKLHRNEFKQILSKINSNAIVFNYPGVGASSGLPNKKAMVKAYHALLTFLEDKEKGIGAKEIVGYGFSLGGGIQGEALKSHQLKEDVKYVFIKDRTFSTLSKLVSQMMGRILGFFIKPLGWEMGSLTSSKTLPAPEIIIQTTKKENFHLLESTDDLSESDGVIKKRGSLAFELLKEGIHKNKHYLGTTSSHNNPLDAASIKHLSEIVNQVFSENS